MNIDLYDSADLPKGLQAVPLGPGSKDRISDMLESIQLLNGFSGQEIATLANYVRPFTAAEKTIVFREGHRANFVCLLVDGKMSVYKESDSHKQRRLALVRPGKTIGEMSLIDEQAPSATVVANEDSTMLLLSKKGLERMGEEHPRVALHLIHKLAQLISQRLRQTTGVLVDYLE